MTPTGPAYRRAAGSNIVGAMDAIVYTIRRLAASFRDSMVALLDTQITREDLAGLMWIAAISLVIVLLWWFLDASGRRKYR